MAWSEFVGYFHPVGSHMRLLWITILTKLVLMKKIFPEGQCPSTTTSAPLNSMLEKPTAAKAPRASPGPNRCAGCARSHHLFQSACVVIIRFGLWLLMVAVPMNVFICDKLKVVAVVVTLPLTALPGVFAVEDRVIPP